jgi:hypothetical protein
MALSVLLHVVLFAWVARELRLNAAHFEAIPRASRPPEGIQIIEVRPVTPEEVELRDDRRLIQLPPDPEERTRPPERTPAPSGVPTPMSGGRDEQGAGMTNAEKLQPREGDRRLWKDFEEERMPEYIQSRWARAEGAIRARLSQMLDSLDLSEEQRSKALDWLTGKDDEEWGVTPDGLVLGGTVIPMDVGSMFAEEGPRGRESRAAEADRALIRQQDLQSDIDATLEERNRAIEARLAEERARAALADSTAAPDSSGAAGSSGDP